MLVELGGRTSKRKAMADNVHVTNYLPLSTILVFCGIDSGYKNFELVDLMYIPLHTSSTSFMNSKAEDLMF